jgi:serine/threonine protein kinase
MTSDQQPITNPRSPAPDPLLGVAGSEGIKMNRLVDVDRVQEDIERYLGRWGRIFKAFRRQDSGCVAYGVALAGRRWFVKHSDQARGVTSLRRARHLHGVVAHPALARLYNSFTTPDGLALVYEWLPGQVLYDYTASGVSREEPARAHARFRALPGQHILVALDTIYDAHLTLAEAGFVAVDFYDGCILYDFERHRTRLCDLDEYRPGPFVLEEERLPGSRRFMAPEEWQQGAVIDQVTNVYTLGRAAMILLGNGQLGGPEWQGGPALAAVIAKATAANRTLRQQKVREFVAEWLAARDQAER